MDKGPQVFPFLMFAEKKQLFDLSIEGMFTASNNDALRGNISMPRTVALGGRRLLSAQMSDLIEIVFQCLHAGGAALHLGICWPASFLSPVGTIWRAERRQRTELQIPSVSIISLDAGGSTISGMLHPLRTFNVLPVMFDFVLWP